MPVKVLIEPSDEGGYKATCKMFGFLVKAKTKEEASSRINTMIKDHSEKLKVKGKVSQPKAEGSCTTSTSDDAGCKATSCSGNITPPKHKCT